jgi:hypothetical protein
LSAHGLLVDPVGRQVLDSKLLSKMMGRPVFAKARRLDPDKLRKAEAEFRELEATGIIRRSGSPWSSPLHMVRKQSPCSPPPPWSSWDTE